MLAGDLIVHAENPKELTKKLLELMSNYSKIVGYKVNIQKSVALTWASNGHMEFEIKNKISFTLVAHPSNKMQKINQKNGP